MKSGQFQGYVEQRRRGEISTPPRRASKEVPASPRRQLPVGGVAEATRDVIGMDAFRTLYFSTAMREQNTSVQTALTPREDPHYITKMYLPEVSQWDPMRAQGAPRESSNSSAFHRKIGPAAVLQSPGNVGPKMRLGVAPPAEARSVYQDTFHEFKDAIHAKRSRINPDSYMGKLGLMELAGVQSVNNAEFDLKPLKPNPPFRPFENIDTINQKRRKRVDPLKTVESTYESSYNHPPIDPIDWSKEYFAVAKEGVLLHRENTEAFRAHSSEKHKRSRWGGPL